MTVETLKEHCVTPQGARENDIVGRLRTQVVRNQRILKYGVVGVVGTVLNLAVLAGMLRFFPPQSWLPAAVANVFSTVVNFLLHNLWTFSDRAHQGMRMLRGFVVYVLMCGVGIFISTYGYVQLVRVAGHMGMMNTHLMKSLVPLGCQFVAIFFGAAINYGLNKQFTWPQANGGQSDVAAPQAEALSSARR